MERSIDLDLIGVVDAEMGPTNVRFTPESGCNLIGRDRPIRPRVVARNR